MKLVFGVAAFCGVASAPILANDLAHLSDEFENASTLANWSRVHLVEQWNADQLETYDINTTRPGRMTMMPYTVTWYEDYRGPLSFKEVSGDFVVTTDVRATGRDGTSVPQSQFSLAGIMVRTPRNITPQTWTPDGENYVFLSIGHGNNSGTAHQFEVKTTINGTSTLILSPSPADNAQLQVARLGPYMIMLRREPNQPWVVHRRYHRSDFPATLQVGLVSYTDWFKVQVFAPFVHNSNVLNPPLPPGVMDPVPGRPFAPDLIAEFEYARYFRPELPSNLIGVDLTNATLVPDSELLAFLGENANVAAVAPAISTWKLMLLLLLMTGFGAAVMVRQAIQARRNGNDIESHGGRPLRQRFAGKETCAADSL